MIIWLLIFVLVVISDWLSENLSSPKQTGGHIESPENVFSKELDEVAPYPFFGNGPYVWPPLWTARNPYFWPPPNQMGFPIRWMGRNPALPLPAPH